MKKTALFALAILSLPVVAQDSPRQKIDVSKLPTQSRVVEDVIVPVPSEIFSVLDKLGKPNWVAVQRPLKGVAQPIGTRPQQALYLGTIIAEGFIAVEANDTAEVKNIGNSVLNLSKALGVREAVTKRANAIITEADKANWPAVRRELDGALNEVKKALEELKSPEEAHLVALGGWVRGTEALCEVVARDYSRDGADLLHQPVLLNHFASKLAGMKDRFKKEALVQKSQATLNKIRPLIGNEEGAEISKDNVKAIGAATSELIKAIQTK